MKFLDIHNQDKKIEKVIIKNFKNNILKTDFILGDKVQIIEKKFASFCGS